MHVPTTVPVLIVGGGPVGLTLSNLLSWYGVDHLLVEARPGTSRHPKARGVSARSMEIFRRCGLEDAVRGAALPASQVFFYRGRDLVDPDFVRSGVAHDASDGGGSTPSPGVICSQDVLEPVLLGRARELAADRIRFGTRLLSCTQDEEGVRAVLEERADGERHTVRAEWLVGCDGAASTVRAGAGIGMDGPTGLGHFPQRPLRGAARRGGGRPGERVVLPHSTRAGRFHGGGQRPPLDLPVPLRPRSPAWG
ncbi:FAD-dependent monooxygenase [Streptomyces sp. NPDC094045]|uniref:FAD-dependent monooxygenase n=1 Tax=Streptomyces sp. NPDC094045 TaxID=3161019 RepID=UPI00339AFA23